MAGDQECSVVDVPQGAMSPCRFCSRVGVSDTEKRRRVGFSCCSTASAIALLPDVSVGGEMLALATRNCESARDVQNARARRWQRRG